MMAVAQSHIKELADVLLEVLSGGGTVWPVASVLPTAIDLTNRLQKTAAYKWNKSFRETVNRLKLELVHRRGEVDGSADH